MKKLAYILSLCIVFFGVFAFAGCGDGMEIKNIKIKTMPDIVNYTVGNSLSVKGGEFTVEYKNGTKRVFDLSFAERNVSVLNEAGNITVTITYGGASDTFNVTVKQKDFTPNYSAVVNTVYTGEAQPVTLISASQLPEGMTLTKTEYAVSGQDEYSENAPSAVGKYTIRVTIDGGKNYVSKTLTAEYNINKAEYADFATNKCLIFKPFETITYGADFDLSKYWQASQTSETLTTIPLDETLAQNITYYYNKKDTATLTAFTPDTSGKIFAKLDEGTYVITVKGAELDNLKGFSITKEITVTAKTLEYGTDYRIKVIDEENAEYAYTAPDINGNNICTINADLSKNLRVEVEFLGDAKDDCEVAEISYKCELSQSDIKTTLDSAGLYRVEIKINSKKGNFILPTSTYNAFYLAELI